MLVQNATECVWASVYVQIPPQVKSRLVATHQTAWLFRCGYTAVRGYPNVPACACVCVCLCVCTHSHLHVCLSAGVFLLLRVIWLRCFLNSNELGKSPYVFVSPHASVCMRMGLLVPVPAFLLVWFVCPSCETDAFLRSEPGPCVCFHSRKRHCPSAAKTLTGHQDSDLATLVVGSATAQALLIHSLPQFPLPSFFFSHKDCGHGLYATTRPYVIPYCMFHT